MFGPPFSFQLKFLPIFCSEVKVLFPTIDYMTVVLAFLVLNRRNIYPTWNLL